MHLKCSGGKELSLSVIIRSCPSLALTCPYSSGPALAIPFQCRADLFWLCLSLGCLDMPWHFHYSEPASTLLISNSGNEPKLCLCSRFVGRSLHAQKT